MMKRPTNSSRESQRRLLKGLLQGAQLFLPLMAPHCKCLTAPPHSLSTRSSQRPVSVLQESSPAFLQRRGGSGKGYRRRHPLVGAEELVDAFELLARLVDGGVAYTALEPPEVPLTPGRHILHRPPPTSLRFSSTFKLFSTLFSVLGLQVVSCKLQQSFFSCSMVLATYVWARTLNNLVLLNLWYYRFNFHQHILI